MVVDDLIINKLTNVKYELLTQDENTIYTHGNHLIRCYPKQLLLFPTINQIMKIFPVATHGSDLSDMIRSDLFTFLENSDSDDINPQRKDHDDTTTSVDKKLFKSVNMDDSKFVQNLILKVYSINKDFRYFNLSTKNLKFSLS